MQYYVWTVWYNHKLVNDYVRRPYREQKRRSMFTNALEIFEYNCNVYFCKLVPPSTVCLMLITSDNDNCLTQGVLRNRISCVRGIVMLKANIKIVSPQSAFHNFIVIHKV